MFYQDHCLIGPLDPYPFPHKFMTNRGRAGKVDVESLEKENDKGIDSLAERVGLLKAVRRGRGRYKAVMI